MQIRETVEDLTPQIKGLGDTVMMLVSMMKPGSSRRSRSFRSSGSRISESSFDRNFREMTVDEDSEEDYGQFGHPQKSHTVKPSQSYSIISTSTISSMSEKESILSIASDESKRSDGIHNYLNNTKHLFAIPASESAHI